jgi:hypothetical protein
MLKMLFLAILVFGFTMVKAAVNLPLDVTNWSTEVRNSEPVTAGVPLPQGAVNDLTKLRIVDGQGNQVPAQFKALSKWWIELNAKGIANPSVKWVLCDFLGNVPSKNKASYTLKDDNAASFNPDSLIVTDAAAKITVSTGKIKFTVSKTSFNLFDEVWLDANGNGTFEPTEQIITSLASNGGVITSGTYAAQGGVLGTIHSTTKQAPESVKIIEQGAVKVVIQVTGRHYAAAAGVTKGLYGYKAYITAYAGQPYVDVQYAVTNTYMEGNKPELGATPYTAFVWPFRKYALNFNLNLGAAQTYALLGETAEASGSLSGTPVRLAQDSGTYTLTGATGAKSAKGGVAISDGTLGMMIAMRDFAPNSPKAISVAQGQVALELFPDKSIDYYLDPQSMKNHRFRVQFFGGAYAAGSLLSFWNKTDAPLRMLATDLNWYRDTKAWCGGFAPPPGYTVRKTPATWTRMTKLSYGTNMGWKRYGVWEDGLNGTGDHPNLESVFATYLCDGNPATFESAESWTMYSNDLIALHLGENKFTDFEFVLNPEKHLSDYTSIHSVMDHYNLVVNSFMPTYAWIRNDLPDEGHNPLYHVLEYYLLTGDPFSYNCVIDQAIRSAGGINYRIYGNYSQFRGRPAILDSIMGMPYGPRYIARPMEVCMQAYMVSPDTNFLKPSKFIAYDFRNYMRWSPIGYAALVEDSVSGTAGYGQSEWEPYWRTHNAGVPTPVCAITSQFQQAIEIRALYQYLEQMGDREIRDVITFTSKHMEFIAGYTGTKYTGFGYTWGDYWGKGMREPATSAGFTSSAGEAFAGVCYGYLLNGRRDIYNVISDAIPTHGAAYIDPRLLCFYQSLWKKQTADTIPPAAVTDLAVSSPVPGTCRFIWTATGDDGATGTAAEYQLKYWPANVPLVDFVKRWDSTSQTGWPDMRAPLPYSMADWTARAAAFQRTQEMSFWGAYNVPGTIAPLAAGNRMTFDVSGLTSSQPYSFALVALDKEGNVSALSNNVIITPLAVETAQANHFPAFGFYSVKPNPANPSVAIAFGVNEGKAVSLKLYSISGRLIKTLVAGNLKPGMKSVVWDGNAFSGKQAASGIYLCRLQEGAKVVEKKIVLTR